MGPLPLPSSLAVVHQGALGDFLLALPVWEGIHRLNPATVVRFWSKPAYAQLLAHRPYAGPVRSCDGPELTPFFHEDLWKEASAPAFFQEAEAVLFFGQIGARAPAQRLQKRWGRPVHWIRSFPAPEERQPVSRFLTEQIRLLGWPLPDLEPCLLPPPGSRSSVRAWLEKRGIEEEGAVLVHPGSGGTRKVRPLRRWWPFLRWLREDRELPVLLVLGPADEKLAPFAEEARRRLSVHVLRDLSLLDLRAFLDAGRFYAGCDSGVTHLAAATGIPVAAVFGPTLPEVWAPRGDHVRVIRENWGPEDIFANPREEEEGERALEEVFKDLGPRRRGGRKAPSASEDREAAGVPDRSG